MRPGYFSLMLILISFLNLSAQKNNEKAEMFFYEGTEYLLQQKFESAIDKFDNAIFLNRDYIEAYEKRGEVRAIIGNHSGAITDFSKAIDLILKEGEDSWYSTTNLYYNRGLSKSEVGDYRGAIKDFSIIIEDSKFEMNGEILFIGGYTESLAFFARGIIKYKQNDYQGAIDDFTRYIDNGVEWSQPYLYRGLSKIKINNIEGGCVDFSTAGELGDSDAYPLIREYCN